MLLHEGQIKSQKQWKSDDQAGAESQARKLKDISVAEVFAQHLNGQESAQVEHEHVDKGSLHEFVDAVVVEVVKQRFFVV